jgi:CelD/BcsL family acetyltransferase involved in cellulose biosynthesis
VRLHVVIARTASGQLAGILPLIVRHAGLVRILEWAGHDVFDYNDVIAQDPHMADALWRFVSKQGAYDVALIKDIYVQALSLAPLTQLMHRRAQRKNYFLTLEFSSGEAWFASQSRKLRGDTRRKTEKMQSRGAVAFHVHQKNTAVPSAIIDTLYAQKAAWFAQRYTQGAFAKDGIKAFLYALAQDAAQRGELYLAWLSSGNTIVACHMGFVRKNTLYLYHTTYENTYAEFSPGAILMTETIKAAIDMGLHELDFMRGDETYKQRFASDHRLLSDFVFGRSIFGKAITKIKFILSRPS